MLKKYPLLLVFFLWITNSLIAQTDTPPANWLSQMGYSGLINTPVAYTSEWGGFNFGFSHFDKGAAKAHEAGVTPERSFQTTIGLLPQAELSIKFTRPYNRKDQGYGLGDRSVAARLQVLKETKKLPAILIGIHDPNTKLAYFNTNYIVLSKSYHYKSIVLLGTAGYGFELRPTRRRYLLGVFGGIQAEWKNSRFMLEYDTDTVNIGAGYRFQKWLSVSTSLVNFKHFSGSIFLRFHLEP